MESSSGMWVSLYRVVSDVLEACWTEVRSSASTYQKVSDEFDDG